jgi:hypothetical protein
MLGFLGLERKEEENYLTAYDELKTINGMGLGEGKEIFTRRLVMEICTNCGRRFKLETAQDYYVRLGEPWIMFLYEAFGSNLDFTCKSCLQDQYEEDVNDYEAGADVEDPFGDAPDGYWD